MTYSRKEWRHSSSTLISWPEYTGLGKNNTGLSGTLRWLPLKLHIQHRTRERSTGLREEKAVLLAGLRVPFNIGGTDTTKPCLYGRSLVTFHLSPSNPGTGRGSNTFLEKEQKLYIVQIPEHRMRGSHTITLAWRAFYCFKCLGSYQSN